MGKIAPTGPESLASGRLSEDALRDPGRRFILHYTNLQEPTTAITLMGPYQSEREIGAKQLVGLYPCPATTAGPLKRSSPAPARRQRTWRTG